VSERAKAPIPDAIARCDRECIAFELPKTVLVIVGGRGTASARVVVPGEGPVINRTALRRRRRRLLAAFLAGSG